MAAFFAGPLLAAFLSGYLVNRWKVRQDHVEKRFDELCDNVQKVADLAGEYWAFDASETHVIGAKIMAQQSKLAGLRVMLQQNISAPAQRELENAEASFFRQVTGGTFGVHNRTADSQRIRASQIAAASMIVAVRTARLRDLEGIITRRR